LNRTSGWRKTGREGEKREKKKGIGEGKREGGRTKESP